MAKDPISRKVAEAAIGGVAKGLRVAQNPKVQGAAALGCAGALGVDAMRTGDALRSDEASEEEAT